MSNLFTAENKRWESRRAIPWKKVAAALAVLAVVGAAVAGGYIWKGKSDNVEQIAAEPVPSELSSVEISGVSFLLNQFTRSAREVRGTISDGPLKANVTGSVTADGKFGFGTVNAAGVDGSTLLADGVTYVKGSPTFWSAVGVQTNFPGWVRIRPGFLGDRIYLPAATVSAALAPVERATILGNVYTPSSDATAVFGANGLERVDLPGYNVTVTPADNEGVRNTVRPMFDALGPVANLERSGSAWGIIPPPPPAPEGEPG